MNWIYLSPHLDDAVYSCGGLIWEQTQTGQQVDIWTICAGDAPPGPLSPFAQELHERWQTGLEAGKIRRTEDQQAVTYLGARFRHLNLPDCIYRRDPTSGTHLYTSEEAIFGHIHPADQAVMDWLCDVFAQQIPTDSQVVIPLTIGGHVDHRLVRKAFEQTQREGWYYADYPYAAQQDAQGYVPTHRILETYPISSRGLDAWVEANALYASQLSSFWENKLAMRRKLNKYLQDHEGIRLWKPK